MPTAIQQDVAIVPIVAIKSSKNTSTFAGGPLACALAMTTLDVMLNDGVIENCAKIGEYFRQRAHEVIEKNHTGAVKEIRGMGLINGIELTKESGAPVVDICFKENKVLFNNTSRETSVSSSRT